MMKNSELMGAAEPWPRARRTARTSHQRGRTGVIATNNLPGGHDKRVDVVLTGNVVAINR
jgi:hypothetical protein